MEEAGVVYNAKEMLKTQEVSPDTDKEDRILLQGKQSMVSKKK